MIVDSHAHVIQNWIGACGHPSRDVHFKYLQRMLAFTNARTFRARDGAPADTSALLRPDDRSWGGLTDVNLRVGRFGQMEFTVAGEDYYVQYMPVGMQNIEAPPELMLAQMTYAGIDHAILQAGGAYGRMNDFNAFAQHQYPDRFTALIHVEEARAGEPAQLAEIERMAALGLKGLYVNVESGFAREGFAWELDDARLDPCWELLAARNLILCVELTAGPTNDEAGYMRHLRALTRLLDRFPALRCHLAMGPPVGFFGRTDGWALPEEAEALYRRDTLFVEVTFPISWGGRWEYPYREAHPLIRDMRDRIGADHMMWGSDMPNVERYCTYAQSLTYVSRYCDFLSGREMDLLLGDTAAALYDLPRPPAAIRATG